MYPKSTKVELKYPTGDEYRVTEWFHCVYPLMPWSRVCTPLSTKNECGTLKLLLHATNRCKGFFHSLLGHKFVSLKNIFMQMFLLWSLNLQRGSQKSPALSKKDCLQMFLHLSLNLQRRSHKSPDCRNRHSYTDYAKVYGFTN